jgi:hypothetical protein
LAAQDISPEEVQKSRDTRERLVQEGIIEVEYDVPEYQLNSSEPIIEYSEYTNDDLSVNTEGSRATDFNDNGRRFYILGRKSTNVAEYHLSSSWNIESADFERELDISSEMGSEVQSGTVPHGLYIRKSDGEKMWILNRTEIWEYTLSKPWDISSASPTGYKDFSSDVTRGHDIDFSPNGKKLYVDDRITEVVFQFNLSSSWDVETAELDYAFDISGQQEAVRGTQFSPDGKRMFLMDTERQDILEYSVADPFDLRSASFLDSFSVASESSNPRGLTFKPDLTKYYVTDNTDNRVYEYEIIIVDPVESSLTLNKEKVIANGSAESRIIATLRDPSGNRISGRKVTLSSNSSNTTIDIVNSTTNSSGESRFDVSNTVQETVTYTARSGGVTINDQETVRYVTIDDEESSVSANRQKVIANGSAAGRITVIARDEDGDELENVKVRLESNSSDVDIDQIKKTTDSDGEAVFEVRSQTAETVEFSARGMGVDIDEKATIQYVKLDPEESSIASNKNKAHANGQEAVRIKIVALDKDGDELEGVEIDLVSNSDNINMEVIRGVTDSDGEAEFRITNTVPETVEIQARGVGETIDELLSIRFIPIDTDESEMSITREKILANGSAEAEITVTARDEDGEPFQNAEINIQQDGGNSTITNVQNTTDSDGVAMFKIKNKDTAEITYSARALGVTIAETVTAKFVTVDPDESTVTVNPVNVQADGDEESSITVKTRDKDGDLLEGARVVLQELNGNSTIADSEIITGSEGTAVFTVTNRTPQVVKYRVTAEGNEFPDDVTIGFIPIAPVSLSASSVQAREFQANWEMVQGADHYLIDVSKDSSFTNVVNSYNGFNTGNVTNFIVENVEPGTQYLYRVKAVSDDLVGANSEPIQTTTFPDTPNAVSATGRNALKFTANWESAAGARNYRLDVARDASFNNIIPEFKNIDVGSDLSWTVNNLEPATEYYYRVRSEASPRISEPSNTIETSTLTISSEQSEIVSDQLKVLANGDQSNELRITVQNDEGILLEGLTVILEQTDGNSEIEGLQPVTDDKGVAIFEVSSLTAGEATYSISAAGILIGEISVEFLENSGVLQLGDNFPNPFRNETILPLTVPNTMWVKIEVFNSLGLPVKTVVDEQLNQGHYEIHFESQELASGVYFYRLMTQDDVKTRKMLLVK